MSNREPFDFSASPQQTIFIGESGRTLREGIGVDLFLGREQCAPPTSDRKLWNRYLQLLDEARPGFLRIGFLEPSGQHDAVSPWRDAEGRFDPAHDFWNKLRDIDAWCASRDVNWMIDPWWAPRSLQTPPPPGLPEAQRAAWRGAPADPAVYARMFILPLLQQLRHQLGVKRCRWLGLFNEPIWDQQPRNPLNFGVRPGDSQARVLAACYRAVRDVLDRSGFGDVGLVGPGHLCAWQFPPLDFIAAGVDPSPDLAAWDMHAYFFKPDWMDEPAADFATTHHFLLHTVRRWTDFARQQQKPFFITELGSFYFGRPFWGERDFETLASHSAAINDAQMIVRALHEGVDGFCRWAWCVPRTADGRWSLAEWEGGPDITPSPHIFPAYKALMNALPPRSELLETRNTFSDGLRPRIHSAAARKPDGQRVLVLVHDTPGRNGDVRLAFPPSWAGRVLRRTITDELRKGEAAPPLTVPAAGPHTADLMVTPYSITVLEEQGTT